MAITLGQPVSVWMGEHTGKQGKLVQVYGAKTPQGRCTYAVIAGNEAPIIVPAAYVDPNPGRLASAKAS